MKRWTQKLETLRQQAQLVGARRDRTKARLRPEVASAPPLYIEEVYSQSVRAYTGTHKLLGDGEVVPPLRLRPRVGECPHHPGRAESAPDSVAKTTYQQG